MGSSSLASLINTRITLFAGVITSAAVASGWLLYFAIQAGWKSLYGAALGATFAIVVHAIEHYLHTSRHEALHGTIADEPSPPPQPPRTNYAAVARAGAIIFTFVGIACEQLAKSLVKQMIIPCLISTITLLPIGMLFAAAAERNDSRDSHPLAFLWLGAMLGLASAAAVSVVRLIAGLPVEFGGTFGWWALVGIGFALIAEGRGHSLWRPVVAVMIAIAIVLCFAIFRPDSWGKSTPTGGSLEPTRGNIVTSILGATGYAVDKALRSPDLPSRVWINAKAEIDAHHAAEAVRSGTTGHAHSLELPRRSAWGSAVARWCGCDELREPAHAGMPELQAPMQRALPSAPSLMTITTRPSTTISADGESLAARVLRERSGPWTARLNAPATQPGGSTLVSPSPLSTIDWQSYLSTSKAVIADDYSRQRVLCAELRQGFASGMVRSWIVMLLFAVGLGLAPMAEQKLRPRDYPSSRTRRNDRILALGLAALVIGGALVVRFT